MPNYDKLHVPTQLAFCENKQLAQSSLEQLLADARLQKISKAQSTFDFLTKQIPGLGKCADFWVFVVRFFVISRDVQSAVQNLETAQKFQAQPNSLLIATQQSLGELQKKIEKTTTPKNMMQLKQIDVDFFKQSELLQKEPVARKEVDFKKYMAEKQMQVFVLKEDELQVSQILQKIE